MTKNVGIMQELNFCNQTLEKMQMDDYVCIYWPKVYRGVSAFLLKLLVEKYPEMDGNKIDKTVNWSCEANYQLEECRLSDGEKFSLILQTVDNILVSMNKPRSYQNRILGVELIFPYYLEPFTEWFENKYTEDCRYVSIEIYDVVSGLLGQINKEILSLNRGPAKFQNLKQEFLKAIRLDEIK